MEPRGDTHPAGVSHVPAPAGWKRLALAQARKQRCPCTHTDSYQVVQGRRGQESQESVRARGTKEGFLGQVPFASGLEEYVSFQLLLIKEELRVDLGKGEGTGTGDKEGPECAK